MVEMDTRYARTAEVAAYTKMSVATIRAYVLNKKIPYIKANGIVLFDLAEIDRWLQARSVPVLDRRNSHAGA